MTNVVALQPRRTQKELRQQSVAWLAEALQLADAVQELVDRYDLLEGVADDVADNAEVERDLSGLTMDTGLHAGAQVLEWIAKTAAGIMPPVPSSFELRVKVGESLGQGIQR